jgi:hypothetical protein
MSARPLHRRAGSPGISALEALRIRWRRTALSNFACSALPESGGSTLAICAMSVTRRTKRAMRLGRNTVSAAVSGKTWRTCTRKFGSTEPTNLTAAVSTVTFSGAATDSRWMTSASRGNANMSRSPASTMAARAPSADMVTLIAKSLLFRGTAPPPGSGVAHAEVQRRPGSLTLVTLLLNRYRESIITSRFPAPSAAPRVTHLLSSTASSVSQLRVVSCL